MTPVYKFLAQKIQARLNCLEKSGHMDEWRRRHEDDIRAAVKRYLPRDMCKLYPRSSAAKEAYYAADKASEHLEDC